MKETILVRRRNTINCNDGKNDTFFVAFTLLGLHLKHAVELFSCPKNSKVKDLPEDISYQYKHHNTED